MIQFKAEPYPFRFYCNSTGDLFLPPEEGKDSISLQDMSELPYPLQDLYERFWSETHDGWFTYLVEHDVAESFCETAEETPEDIFDSGIAVLAVDCNGLALSIDRNCHSEDDSTVFYQYRGIIPPERITILRLKE